LLKEWLAESDRNKKVETPKNIGLPTVDGHCVENYLANPSPLFGKGHFHPAYNLIVTHRVIINKG